MARFTDVYLSARIQGYPVEVAPIFSTQIAIVDSGTEQANQRWIDPLREINIPRGVRDQATFEAIKRQWLNMAGPAMTWPWRDPTDFASVDLTRINEAPTVTRTDQALGVGDAVTRSFQLAKSYNVGSPAIPYSRNIHFPVPSTLLIGVDGVDPTTLSPALNWSVSRPGGVVTFDSPPPGGSVITWGGLFDIQVRFEDDESFAAIMQTFNAAGFANIALREVRYCPE